MAKTTENQIHFIQYDGKTSTLYKLWIVNWLLTIVTFGTYRFWGKTKIRSYLTSSFQLAGDRFEYTGTAGELFLGFIRALFWFLGFFLVGAIVYVAAIVAVSYLYAESPELKEKIISYISLSIDVIPFILYFFVYFYATLSSLRYRIARVQWRGIRSSLKLSFGSFMENNLACFAIKFFSLGFCSPRADHRHTQFILKNLKIGNATPQFDGKPEELSSVNMYTLLLLIFTLGLSRIWYKAALLRYRINHLSISGIRFSISVTGSEYLKLTVINVLLLLITFGLAYPYTLQRYYRFLSERERISLQGDLKNVNILQGERTEKYSGEGLATLLDVSPELVF